MNISFLNGTQRSYTQRSRDLWVAGLLRLPCTECPARTGEWCDPVYPPPAEMVRIDRDPPRLIHSTRVVAAVDGRHVSRNLTIAQFAGGPVAAGLAGVLARRKRVLS